MRIMVRIVLVFLLMVASLPSRTEAAQLPVFCIAGFSNRVKITNLSDEQVQAFPIASDFLTDELTGLDIDLRDITKEVTEARMNEIACQLELGEIATEFADIHPDYIIYGFLTNLGVSESKRPGSTASIVRADLSVRIMDISDKRTVFVATGTGEASVKLYGADVLGLKLLRFGTKEFTVECLHEALEKAVKQLAGKIRKAI